MEENNGLVGSRQDGRRFSLREDLTDDSSSFLDYRPYVMFLAGRFLGTLATNSQSVVIAWEVYGVARRTMPMAQASSWSA